MGGKTPATIVSAVTRHNEKLWIGTLDELAAAMDQTGVDEPVLIGIGSVFAKGKTMQLQYAPDWMPINKQPHGSIAVNVA
jgi:uroporphyrin-III C-methyltransferase/precorrin-2 dehydrogenase/sirohydrochlorin ferrochelatase